MVYIPRPVKVVFVGDLVGVLEIHNASNAVGKVSIFRVFALQFLEIGVWKSAVLVIAEQCIEKK